MWTGYSGTIQNPDGDPVGLHYCPSGPGEPCAPGGVVQGASSIASGAILTVTFPIGVSPAGYLVTASYTGDSGDASATLT
jgi:hypothetical protein